MEQMKRIYNFNPGPAALPMEVLLQAQQQFIEYGGKGMSIFEMSHRSKLVEQLTEETQQLLLEHLGLPATYRVLFMGGGASAQFALIPLNFLKEGQFGQYILSGSFSEKAYLEAQTIGAAAVLSSSKAYGWSKLPNLGTIELNSSNTAYVHMTTNNTIEGSQFQQVPELKGIPLIGDMTSELLSRKLDLSKFSMLYASAQKNLGPAGVTVAVIDEAMLKQSKEKIPTIFKYKTFADNQSLYNTPPVHAIYMMKLVLEWVSRQGGVAVLERRNIEKAALLYEVIDQSGGFYEGVVEKADRSMMNITWRMKDVQLEQQFIAESELCGFDGLAGHRSVGGLRASAYNAVPLAWCEALATFMIDFQKKFGF